MQRNFRIEQGVELCGEFGILDIHDAYDLERWEFLPTTQTLRFAFVGNEHRLHNRPPKFDLEFVGVSAFESRSRLKPKLESRHEV